VTARNAAGLTTAEIDLGSSGDLAEPVPDWPGVEVTDIEAFTGREPARREAEQLAGLPAAYRG
jgi:hypothetical protein